MMIPLYADESPLAAVTVTVRLFNVNGSHVYHKQVTLFLKQCKIKRGLLHTTNRKSSTFYRLPTLLVTLSGRQGHFNVLVVAAF